MKILIKGFKKAVAELKLFDFTSFIVALLVIIPILNFLVEGVQYVLSGNFSLGIAGGEEVLETLKVLVLTSFFGGGLGTLNGWLLSNCDFKFRKVLRICQLIPLAAPAYLITAVLQDLGSIFGYQVTGIWGGVLIPPTINLLLDTQKDFPNPVKQLLLDMLGQLVELADKFGGLS